MDSSWLPTADSAAIPPVAESPPDVRAPHAPSPATPVAVGPRVAAAPLPHAVELQYQDRLVQVRLGLASSLFAALRARHEATAAHCLRVALGCSSWSELLKLPDRQRDALEVAGLLHDIGKIGVPDQVLLKIDPLTSAERLALDQRRAIGEQILLSCCASQDVLSIVKYAPAWYDGTRPGFDLKGDQLPLGARVVSIMDAYDAMISEQVYRAAMTVELATAELLTCAGSQFDPELVEQFCESLTSSRVGLTPTIARRWLQELSAAESNKLWQGSFDGSPSGSLETALVGNLFHQKLLDSMHDGVIFVDMQLNILLWNRAAERLTGRTAAEMLRKRWSPQSMGMRGEDDSHLDIRDSPVHRALNSRVQTLRRLTLARRNNERVSVDAHAVPVIGRNGVMYGATLLLHDASFQINLEERVQTLHRRATRDPLTNVANRAEFDRVHTELLEHHQETGRACALIMCDIDHFKKVNDTFGHQAGDEVLVRFAGILQRHCRATDLVARYGGEEFVILCADSTSTTALARAEKIRRELEVTPQPCLDNDCIRASFGVTEIQAGDTPETMLRRADRALLRAKESGRNRVVQLGTGLPPNAKKRRRRHWRQWFQPTPSTQLLEETLVTAVPLAVTMEKLRGFVSDHHAEIVATEDGKLQLLITKQSISTRRADDRPISLLVSLQFLERRAETNWPTPTDIARTMIHVTIRLANNRDRRRSNAYERARQLFASLQSYFMAQMFDGQFDPGDTAANPTIFTRLLAFLHRWGPPHS
jgi:diguanylate cyclase (GGDEF)-like protein/PAS domain S-box-containing protein